MYLRCAIDDGPAGLAALPSSIGVTDEEVGRIINGTLDLQRLAQIQFKLQSALYGLARLPVAGRA